VTPLHKEDSLDHADPPVSAPIRLNLAQLDRAAEAASELASRYNRPLSGGRSPVGAHFRHVIDHYDCFFEGVETGRVDYYTRKRDPAIQSDPSLAVEAMRRIQTRIRALSGHLDATIQVDTGGPDGGDGQAGWAVSSVRRELAFVLSHTLHHLAQIRGMALELGVELGEDVGVAHSTLGTRAGGAAAGVASGREAT